MMQSISVVLVFIVVSSPMMVASRVAFGVNLLLVGGSLLSIEEQKEKEQSHPNEHKESVSIFSKPGSICQVLGGVSESRLSCKTLSMREGRRISSCHLGLECRQEFIELRVDVYAYVG